MNSWFRPKRAFAKRAVAYYRHSAQERQENSVEIQQDQVRKFAADNGIEIIEEFIDRGKTGLITEGRDAFKRMLSGIQSGKYDCDYVLVLDVSRWGRYQNTDISAYYTGLCEMQGKQVIYTSIGFPPANDLIHMVRVNIERYQAANYSRELSLKVFKGCAKIASQGYRAGGTPPYGLHRLLLDERRQPVQELSPGQRKSIQNQRVTLTPGDPNHIAVVKRIFRAFTQGRKPPKEIADTLNAECVPSPGDAHWTTSTVRSILTNELYAGTMVYNKTTQRLKSPSRTNPHEDWVRTANAFPAVIERTVFDDAQAILAKTQEEIAKRYSDADMVGRLRAVYERYGVVRSSLIAHESGMVSAGTYAQRFGGMSGAYQRLFTDVIASRRAEVSGILKSAIPDAVECDDFLVLRDYVSVLIQPVVPFPIGYEAAWSFVADNRPEVDITLGVPLSNGGEFAILGYMLFPRLMVGGRRIQIASTMPEQLDLHAYTIPQALRTMIG
ncbi:MAG: recombinase family protein [FCB group bacterium]|jgi:DNA invertase Pin-like site-specific DNA recombinase|nr:recombinase family protein [FCB group bacterium]